MDRSKDLFNRYSKDFFKRLRLDSKELNKSAKWMLGSLTKGFVSNINILLAERAPRYYSMTY